MVAKPAAENFIFQHSSGSVECKLCLSIHPSLAAYYSHAQGKQHLSNVESVKSKSAAAESSRSSAAVKRKFHKIGIPKYDIVKIRDPETLQLGVRLDLQLQQIKPGIEPQFRIMSAYEQTIDEVDTNYQYLVVAAEPYDSVALRIPSTPIDEQRTLSHYNSSEKLYRVQLLFKEIS